MDLDPRLQRVRLLRSTASVGGVQGRGYRSKPATHGTRCESCGEARRKAATRLRNERRKGQLCLTCGRKAAKGRRHCRKHLEYYATRHRELYAK